MPQGPPAPETAPAGVPSRAGRVRVERLEYGKFCVRPEGPIEDMAEYRQLGWSEGFPPWLVNSCAPSVIGISSDAFAFDASLEGPEHGTVLRPVVPAAGRPAAVMCRVRTRPEGGEGKEGRRYTVARYAASQADDLDPRALLWAMDSTPLHGVTHQDIVNHLSPLWAEPRELPEDGLLFAFLRDALVYLLSGVPVAVMRGCEEGRFFGWVAAAWHALPRGLRPFLSAGWGVGGQLSGRLAVSYATRQADTCAAFDPDTGRWAEPARVLVRRGGEANKEDFAPNRNRLTAGHVYVERILGWGAGGAARPRLAELRAAADAWPPSGSLPNFEFESHPEWPDASTARAFRYPGLKRFDDDRADEHCRWLEDGETRDGTPPPPDARSLVYPESRLRVFARGVAALAVPDGGQRARGDAVVWASLAGRREPAFVAHIERALQEGRPGATRARLLLVLREESVAGALHWLLKSAAADAADKLPETGAADRLPGTGVADELPREAEAVLHRLLGAGESLTHADNLSLHLKLLRHPNCPEPYLNWLRAQPFGLSLRLLDTRGPEGIDHCSHIHELTGAPSVQALLRLPRKKLPTEDDRAALAALGEQEKLSFTGYLLGKWPPRGENVRKMRELLLQWMKGLPVPGETEEPLLRLWLGHSLTRFHLGAIMDEVDQRAVPPSLLPAVADLTRRNFHHFSERVYRRPNEWAPVFSYVLPEVAHALNVKRDPSPEGEERARAMSDARAVQMRGEQADYLINLWASPDRRRDLRRAAPLLWGWAAKSFPSPALHSSASDLCRVLDQGLLPELKPPGEIAMHDFQLLAKEAGKDEELRPQAQILWGQSKRGWQLRVLMDLFPAEEFEPTLMQVSKLVFHQKWLRSHLKRTTVHPTRAERFALAAVSFQGLDFPGTDDLPWSREVSETVMWAAYRGIPFKHQGGLRDALDAYGEDLQERAKLCLKYVRSYKQDLASYEEALGRALVDFLLPQFGRAGMNTGDMASILLRGEEEEGGWFGGSLLRLGRPQGHRPNYDAALEPLVDEAILRGDRKVIRRAIEAFRQKHKR